MEPDFCHFFLMKRNPPRIKAILMMKYRIPFGAVAVPKRTITFPKTAIIAINFFKKEFFEKTFFLNN